MGVNSTTHNTVSLRLVLAVTPSPTLRPLAPLPACLEFPLVPPGAYSETLGGSWNIRNEPRPSAVASAFPPGPSRGQESAQMPLPPAWAPPPDTCVRSSAWPDAHIRCLGRLTAGGLSVVSLGKRRADWPGMGEGGCSGPGPSTCRPWTLRGGGGRGSSLSLRVPA